MEPSIKQPQRGAAREFKSESGDWLDLVRRNWGTLTQGAVLILSVISSFLLAPPAGASEGDANVYTNLARFVVAVLVGLMLVLSRKFNRPPHVKFWWGIAVVLLVSSIAAFLGYQHLTNERTCRYLNQTIVIGADFTPMATNFLNENLDVKQSGRRCELLLDAFPGDAEESAASRAGEIWTSQSIEHSRLLLAITYLSCLPLFTVCLIAVVQAIYSMNTN